MQSTLQFFVFVFVFIFFINSFILNVKISKISFILYRFATSKVSSFTTGATNTEKKIKKSLVELLLNIFFDFMMISYIMRSLQMEA